MEQVSRHVPEIVADQPDAPKPPPAFRASYGFLRIDITGRLLRRARLSAQGLSAEDVDIPSGSQSVVDDIKLMQFFSRQRSLLVIGYVCELCQEIERQTHLHQILRDIGGNLCRILLDILDIVLDS